MATACETAGPIFQIHPTRRCNLRCLHCYSLSSPDERQKLPYETVSGALDDAREQGYSTASFSGGEPFLYPELGRAVRYAKSLGMRTTVTSNGMLITPARLAELAGSLDVLAISLDGAPESHDHMRDFPGSFDRMAANLDTVRASGIDFGFIFTLTQYNLHEADWAAQFAVSQGAKLLQVHPLEEVGRASGTLAGSRPDEIESTYAFLEAERIRQTYGNRLFVQLDIFHRELLHRFPERFYADEQREPRTRLADCVAPLVLEADGTLVPVGYGFGRRYAIGNVLQSRMRDLASEWIPKVYPAFRELCRGVYEEACRPSELPFLNWYELLQLRSVESSELTMLAAAHA
jgi:MoaA/NifB/PqqE/SkfB family radical SAM enzyme